MAWLSQVVDLETSARQYGALQRLRKIRNAASLLRLALFYGPGGLSLRCAAAAAGEAGIAALTDNAVRKRLSKLGDWLEFLLAQLLAQTRGAAPPAGPGGTPRLLDGTMIRRKGRPSWRVHARYNPLTRCFDDLVLTLEKVGESVTHTAIAVGELLLTDRGYARVRDFRATLAARADFICRIGWRALRLRTLDGQPFHTLADLPTDERPIEHQVRVHGLARPVRFIIAQLPGEKAAKQRERVARRAQRSGHKITPETVLAAGYLMLVTSLPESVAATWILDLYRCRWQIELAFKRLKSLGHIDKLPAVGAVLGRVWLLAHLIAAVITDQMVSQLDATATKPSRPDPRDASLWRLWKQARRILLAAILPSPGKRSQRRRAQVRDSLTEGKRRRTVQADRLKAA